jgi:hypothetical protein
VETRVSGLFFAFFDLTIFDRAPGRRYFFLSLAPMGVPDFKAETASFLRFFRRKVNCLAEIWLFPAFPNNIRGKKRGTPVGG